MTQEDKELLLKDLSSRLPYGVNVEYTSKAIVIATNTEEIITRPLFLYSINTLDDMTVSGIDDDGDSWICFFEEIKPYLLPLSSMTEEQRNDISKLLIDTQKEFPPYGELNIKGCDNLFICTVKQANALINYCLTHHLDINGLIEKGLAIDATGLNIY